MIDPTHNEREAMIAALPALDKLSGLGREEKLMLIDEVLTAYFDAMRELSRGHEQAD